MPASFSGLTIESEQDLLFGHAPKPVTCGRNVAIGQGTVVPEINFTLPACDIGDATWQHIRQQYQQMIENVARRAVELDVPALLVEFETLPPMTEHPAWGHDITRLLADNLDDFHAKHGLKSALRLTPNDTRDHIRPPLMRRGVHWENMLRLFEMAAPAGADLLAIESTGGKELCDDALMACDLRALTFALGVLAPRDMRFLWSQIISTCESSGVIPSGDTACGFANTAMVLAEQRYIPRVFAALVRTACVPRSLVAYEVGAVGPSKDCAYEGPYLKVIAGVPISMEGHTAACAHLSPVGNIAQAVADCWSNESVQNVKLLSGDAPTVSMEQLAYDCRLMNVAAAQSASDARRLRDWLVASDSARDPQAYVLRPDVVVRIARAIMHESTPYLRTRRALQVTLEELWSAHRAGEVLIAANEERWLPVLSEQIDQLPESEDALIDEMLSSAARAKFIPEEYGLLP